MRQPAVELLELVQEEEGPQLLLVRRPQAIGGERGVRRPHSRGLRPPLPPAALILLLRILDEAELLE
eukprot:12076761-Alexandrium_andersonii.AAC.1